MLTYTYVLAYVFYYSTSDISSDVLLRLFWQLIRGDGWWVAFFIFLSPPPRRRRKFYCFKYFVRIASFVLTAANWIYSHFTLIQELFFLLTTVCFSFPHFTYLLFH